MNRPRSVFRTLVLYAGPLLFWMAVIFAAGTDVGSANESRGWLTDLLARTGWLRGLSPAALQALNIGLRKAGHVLSYALLGLLLARLFRHLRGRIDRGTLAMAWTAAVAWAGIDEAHQAFFPSRGSSLGDVLIDAAGAALGILVYRAWLCRPAVNS